MQATGVFAMVSDAMSRIETIPTAQAIQLHASGGAQLVDIRDIRELQREGCIPSAFHCPRGMLEFWIDPASPYHKPIFASGKRFVFFCAGAQRSALAADTAKRMGLHDAAHIEGGFKAWSELAGPVIPYQKSRPSQPKPQES